MYRFTLLICTFVLCMNYSESAPSSSLLSALLSQQQDGASREKSPETGLTTYDQKQTGKYNIHLNIKDVAIIALDAGRLDSGVGDFGEDYYEDYDLSDFTVKPIFGLIDIASDKPSSSSTTEAPPLIHFESDEEFLAANNKTEIASNGTAIEEPIIKDPINKTQSVVILSPSTASSVTILPNDGSISSGIVVTTPTPAPEDLPPKLSLADLANIHSASPISLNDLFQTKPNEIPVQIILEQIQGDKESSRQRPHPISHTNFSPNGNWRLRNRVRATPSSNNNRRITPPHDVFPSNPSIGNNKQRKSSNVHANRRNCVHDQTGQCQNSNRRFSSPTFNGIMSLLSFLSPQALEKLD